jgi:hypothetical protein
VSDSEVRKLHDCVQSLKEDVQAIAQTTGEIKRALVGDPLNLEAAPGLITRVTNVEKREHCDADVRLKDLERTEKGRSKLATLVLALGFTVAGSLLTGLTLWVITG